MNKVAVVTGGAGGIGQAVADRLTKNNYAVVILDVNDEAAKPVVADFHKRGVELPFHRADLTQEAQVQAAFEKITAEFHRIDVLVNVAGGSMHRHKFEEFPLKNWQAVIDANLTSTFLCCRAVVGTMKNQKSGAIVNISSDIAFSGSESLGVFSGEGWCSWSDENAGARARDFWRAGQRRRPGSNFDSTRACRLLG